jgi:outer membrane lipoprotein-sorting protein
MFKKPSAISLLAAAALLTLATRSLADPPSAADLVAAADRVRNPQQPFRMSVALVEYVSGRPRDSVNLAIHSKIDKDTRHFKNLVRYAGPPRDAGKLVLLNASSMWFYDPASKASVRISPQQRLTGQASDGDVLTVNLARDYTSKLVGEESIKDADHQERSVWHLDLAASTGDATYTRLEYWIEKQTNRAVKAKFYADSGRLLKIAYYRKYEEQLGAARPTETLIIDAVDSNLVTRISYSDFSFEEVQDAWFQRDYLPRFKEE